MYLGSNGDVTKDTGERSGLDVIRKVVTGTTNFDGRMKRHETTNVPLLWATDTQRLAYRGQQLDLLLSELIQSLPEQERAHWESRRRGVDARVRAVYYGCKFEQPDNETKPNGETPKDSSST